MSLKYRVDDTNKSVAYSTSRLTTPSICYIQNNTTYYVPLLENGTATIIGDYIYSVSGKTICCRYNNKTYKAATSATINYDIPEGTYTPSAFKDIIENYISPGGARPVKFGFQVIVNNQSVSVQAGKTIFYNQVSSGNNQARLVGFGYNGTGVGGNYVLAIDFANYKQYCVWCNLGTNTLYQTYENFSITIQHGGIKFA